MREFEAVGPLHLAAIVAIGVASWAVAFVRRRLDAGRGRQMDVLFAGGLAAAALFCHGTRYLLEPIDGAQSLPLHLCHLSSVLAPIAIVTSWWPSRVLLYFWGLILGSQALITPELHVGPAKLEFWRFWVGHGAIAMAAVYDLAARGFRPGLGAAGFAIAASVAYVALVTPLNLLSDANFGYLGPRKPRGRSVIDFLGPWPLRMLWIGLIGSAVIVAAALPWERGLRRRPVPLPRR